MALTSQHVHDALRTVKDPELHKDLVTLNMVKDVRVDGNDVALQIELTTPACPLKDQIRNDIEQAVNAKAREVGATIGAINIEFTADVRKANERLRDKSSPLPDDFASTFRRRQAGVPNAAVSPISQRRACRTEVLAKSSGRGPIGPSTQDRRRARRRSRQVSSAT